MGRSAARQLDTAIALRVHEQVRALLMALLVYVFYPLWLLAGAVDYLLHRASDIEFTSGAVESWLHLAQFAALSVALLLVSCLRITAASLLLVLLVVLIHSLLAYIDVSYTLGRRHISALEQLVHGYLDLIPLFAVAVLAVLHLEELRAAPWALTATQGAERARGLLLWASFVCLAGLPIAREVWRTRSAVRNAEKRPRGGVSRI